MKKINQRSLESRRYAITGSLKIAKAAQQEFDDASDFLRVGNQDLVIARLEGKLELVEELLRSLV